MCCLNTTKLIYQRKGNENDCRIVSCSNDVNQMGVEMSKMKDLLIEMEETGSTMEELMAMREESHYWMLVDNVANWVVDNKSTLILDDIAHKVRHLYINGEHSGNVSKKGK